MNQQSTSLRSVFVSGLALFAMFFGAGNIIFPPMLGVQSGTNLVAAIFGFVMTAVLLPALGIVAAGTSTTGVFGLTKHVGLIFGRTYTTIVFLSIGVLYAIPRVATVAYETSLHPLLEAQGVDVSPGATGEYLGLIAFTLFFFAVTALLTYSPGKLVDRVGTWLTPALIILLALLIVVGLFTLSPMNAAPVEKYAQDPLAVGLLDGYNTMDALASIVFGGVIIDSLRRAGYVNPRKLFKATIGAGLIASFFLAVVYIGLAMLGARTPAEGLENGAQVLSASAGLLFGNAGQVVFGLTVFLACLTTAVGLVGASVQYFQKLFPSVGFNPMLLIHLLISLVISNLGLTLILKVVVPLVLLTYPVTIALIGVALISIFVRFELRWSFRLAVWTAAVFAAWSSLRAAGLLSLDAAWDVLPLSSIDMAWLVPASIMLVVGLVVDFNQKLPKLAAEEVPVA
ncbi:branched-chain amino acid transport system II carrier protein [Boudabousia marimammalium]|uniref:Branched-chain amino acid transport system II carrier protein n=1 Tax=Boudabousia marimammalium TaxID=156892 RepID=A0A1Q5PMA9_9ACTO|nr:branched-chain amino acid transport system II carrier protein [Boudabousia marimammalium]OKL48681.1 branched-chain amino acid transport system II carrier protein [Boudabousia marimammalium]